MERILTLNDKGAFVIPEDILEATGIKPGDQIDVLVDWDDDLVIRRVFKCGDQKEA